MFKQLNSILKMNKHYFQFQLHMNRNYIFVLIKAILYTIFGIEDIILFTFGDFIS